MPGADAAVWGRTFIALVAVSGASLFGAVGLVLSPRILERGLLLLISFAAGALLGDAFLHLLPEIAETATGLDVTASLALLGGVLAFFVLEKFLHWHHAHIVHEEVIHPIAITNLVGDGLHNFLDGAIVAASFAVSTELGIATTIAVALHEIPQELGDFAILVHAGLKPRRALWINFITALAAFAGGGAVLAFATVGGLERFFLPFSAGAFVYIASTDLIPELHKEPEVWKSALQLVGLVIGIGVMGSLLLVE